MELTDILEFSRELSTHSKDLSVEVTYSNSSVEYINHHFGAYEQAKVFDIASVTKMIQTTYLLMILVQQNEISLDSPVNDFLNIGPVYDQLNLKELLWHTSGLKAWLPLYFFIKDSSELEAFLRSKNILNPGQKGQRVYSDFNFMLLGLIIEKVRHESLSDSFKNLVVKKIGLTHTFYESELESHGAYPTSLGNPFEKNYAAQLGLDVESFKWNSKRVQARVNDLNCHEVFKGVAGHCGLFSNSSDLHRVGQALVNYELVNEKVTSSFTDVLKAGNCLGLLADPKLLGFGLNNSWRGHHGFTGCTLAVNFKSKEVFSFLSNRQVCGLDHNKKYKNWKT